MTHFGRLAAVCWLVFATMVAGAETMAPAGDELRFQGSNTVGARLAPRLVEEYLKSRGASFGEWRKLTEPVEVKGKLKDEAYFVLDVSGGDAGVPRRIYVRPYGSATAFPALLKGEAEIGMASRQIKPDEILELAALGDMTSPENEHVIGLDGVAVIVHPDNPLASLKMEQITGIFACEIRDWSEVGGRAGPIQVYARDDNSGTYDTFKTIVLDDGKRPLCGNAKRYEGNAQLSADLQKNQGGIGFVGMAQVAAEADKGSKGPKAVKLDAGALSFGPSAFGVKTEEYPISRRLYFYTPEQKSPFVDGFLRFAQTDAAQAVVDEVRYVDLRVGDSGSKEAKEHRLATCRAAAVDVQDPKVLGQMIKDTQGADRLSVTFRFRFGSFTPDNKALTDMKRVVEYLRQDENRGRKLLLLGFADGVGAYQANCGLSLKRAQAIGAKLQQLGVEPALVKGYCEESPVAIDDAREGAEKNRRVEVWLR